mmetsp:Transcript_5889/g.14115  ORF Transcript_5889/g.14115 Transcript_5889/m.14115 type:complete len:219 (-) Transcript_5889:159-815(-)
MATVVVVVATLGTMAHLQLRLMSDHGHLQPTSPASLYLPISTTMASSHTQARRISLASLYLPIFGTMISTGIQTRHTHLIKGHTSNKACYSRARRLSSTRALLMGGQQWKWVVVAMVRAMAVRRRASSTARLRAMVARQAKLKATAARPKATTAKPKATRLQTRSKVITKKAKATTSLGAMDKPRTTPHTKRTRVTRAVRKLHLQGKPSSQPLAWRKT